MKKRINIIACIPILVLFFEILSGQFQSLKTSENNFKNKPIQAIISIKN